MAGLAVVMFLVAAALVVFALLPRLAFYLEEGWKFDQELEPSDAYVSVSMVGRLLAATGLAVFGAWLLMRFGA